MKFYSNPAGPSHGDDNWSTTSNGWVGSQSRNVANRRRDEKKLQHRQARRMAKIKTKNIDE